MIFTDLIEYIFVGDTKGPVLRYFPFISKIKAGDILTTEQYMSYQKFIYLQFRTLLKISSHSIHIGLREIIRKKLSFICRYQSFGSDVSKSLQLSYLK